MGICGSSAERPPGGAGEGGARDGSRGGGYGSTSTTPSGSRREGGLIRGPGGIRIPTGPWTLEGRSVEEGIISASDLKALREEFWGTRAEGAPEAWEALKVSSEALLNDDASLASTILSSAGLRLGPAGVGFSEVWDTRGVFYRVPRYCWQTPSNAASDEVAAAARSAAKPHEGPPKPLDVVVRLSPSEASDEQDVALDATPSDTTASSLRVALHELLKAGGADAERGGGEGGARNVFKGRGLPPSWQTVVYAGRVLGDDEHLQGIGYEPGTILQVFVRPPAGTEPLNTGGGDEATDGASASTSA